MAWLNEVNQNHTIFALTAMDELWKNYETGTGLINGISAMPSMHVGASILFAILGFASGKKWLGYLLSAFAFLIFNRLHSPWAGTTPSRLRRRGRRCRLLVVAGKVVDWDSASAALPSSRPSSALQ